LSDPELVPIVVAGALRLPLPAGKVTPERIASAIGAKRILLVLDNCEQVIESAARMAEALLQVSPLGWVLATSREPLRADGESLYWVPALDLPDEGLRDPHRLMQSGAVHLFVERVRAAGIGIPAGAQALGSAAEICRRLYGIPLAIELAAARAASLGVDGLAAHLHDQFSMLSGGDRTGPTQHHQTMLATLDWSHQLLSDTERTLLRRLAVFAGGFTLEAISAVAESDNLKQPELIDNAMDLIAKSLVVMDTGGSQGRYRLLETTKAYALERLVESGEFHAAARRHAEYYRGFAQYHRDSLERAEGEWNTRATGEWLAAYIRQIDNVRAALDWAFSEQGDADIGVALTLAAVPLWMHLSLMQECRRRVEQALQRLDHRASGDGHREMELLAALGAALMYTKGAVPETRSAFARALEIADELYVSDYRLRALWGLWVDRMNNGAVREAATLAETFCRFASNSTDPLALPIGDRTMGFALHFLGEQSDARRHLEHMLDGPRPPVHGPHVVRFQFDPWLTAHSRLAVILWLQGYPDQALRSVQRVVEEALSANHAVTLCNAFAQGACPVALLTGDLAAAERFVTTLLDYSTRHGLAFWQADGRCFRGVLLIRYGDVAQGLGMLRSALDELSRTAFHTRYDAFLGELAEALGRIGRVVEGLAAIDAALDRAQATEGLWYMAELLRIKGEIVLLGGASTAAAAAEKLFLEGLGWARRQGALSWELRCATSLAGLWSTRQRGKEAAELLAPVYARFTEGLETADLRAAKALLGALP
jgi:predicted ATPase